MNLILKVLKCNYKKAPQIIRHILLPGFWFYHFIRKSYNLLRPCVWLIRGSLSQSKDPISVLYCGDDREKNYLVRIAFLGECTQTEMGRKWSWQINNFIGKQKEEIDLLIYDIPKFFSLWLGYNRCFYIPTWVRGVLDLSLIDFNNRSLKEDIRNILKSGFTFEVTTDKVQLERFYREMYVPHAAERYGEELELGDFEDILQGIEHAELLLVKQNEEYVAGDLFYYKDGKVHLKYIGVKSGENGLVKSGARQATYYFVYCYLKNKGYKIIEAGGSRAFFRDGVLIFKKKWGLRFTRCQKNVMRVCPLKDTRGVRNFLTGNPCIALEGKDLVAIVFIEKDGELTEDDLKEYANYLRPGLKKVVLYCFGSGGSTVTGLIEKYGIIIRSAKELFKKTEVS